MVYRNNNNRIFFCLKKRGNTFFYSKIVLNLPLELTEPKNTMKNTE